MTNSTILYVVLILFAAYVAWDKLAPRVKKILNERRSQAQATAELILSIDKLTLALNGDESTKMLAGTLKACEAIATATVELRDEIAAFGKLVRIDDKQYPTDQITQPDPIGEEKMMTFIQAIAKGRTVQEATQQAADDAEKKMMFSAVTLDPMGGE